MFSLSVLPRSMRLGSVIAADADTSTIVVVPATLTEISIVAVAPALSAIPVRRVVPNPGRLYFDIVGPQRQHRKAIQAGIAGLRRLLEAVVDIGDLHRRAGNRGAGGIGYRPGNLSIDCRLLAEDSGRQGEPEAQYECT